MLGNDITTMTPKVLGIITNQEVIDVNQDSFGKQGVKIRDDGDYEVWSKQLSDGGRAIVLFNRSETGADISFNWTEIAYDAKLKLSVRDLWEKRDLGKYSEKYSAMVPPHGVVMIRLGR
jgi:alpha-galactosidase